MRRALRLLVGCTVLALGGSGCDLPAKVEASSAGERAASAQTTDAPPRPAAVAEAVRSPVRASETLTITAGQFTVGSMPGSEGRDPTREADLIRVELPAFQIDRLPYPNDPAIPPLTGVGRAEAQSRCEAGGKRLCSELEWERACKGPAESLFPSGAELDSRCSTFSASPECSSGFGVLALGTVVQEWTGSDVTHGETRRAVVRGGGAGAAPTDLRCAARSLVAPERQAERLGFRCCGGGPPRTAYPEQADQPGVRPLDLDVAAIRSTLSKVEQLAPLAPGFAPFGKAEVDAALRRGGRTRDGITLWSFMPSAFAWSPTPGEEIWVLSGSTERGALLALLYPFGDGSFAHARSTLIEEPDSSIAVGWNPEYRDQLTWTTCFGCPGAGGIVRFGEDARVSFAYR